MTEQATVRPMTLPALLQALAALAPHFDGDFYKYEDRDSVLVRGSGSDMAVLTVGHIRAARELLPHVIAVLEELARPAPSEEELAAIIKQHRPTMWPLNNCCRTVIALIADRENKPDKEPAP